MLSAFSRSIDGAGRARPLRSSICLSESPLWALALGLTREGSVEETVDDYVVVGRVMRDPIQFPVRPQIESRRPLRLVLIIGALSAFAPLSIDMYLPALP